MSSNFSVPQGWGNSASTNNIPLQQPSIPPNAAFRPPPTSQQPYLLQHAPNAMNNPNMMMMMMNYSDPSFIGQQPPAPQQLQLQPDQQPLDSTSSAATAGAPPDQNGWAVDASISTRPHFQSDIYINDPRELSYLKAADFQRPASFPTALHVKPPTIAPYLVRPASRFSEHKYCNPQVPSYVPPELLLWGGDGQPLQSLLDRARFEDLIRLHRGRVDGLYFMRKDGELPEDFKVNAYVAMKEQIELRKQQIQDNRNHTREFLASRSVNSETAQRSAANMRGRLAGYSNLEYTADGRILHRLFFTKEVMQEGRYGAIFGFRGSYHRQLEKETGCRITLGGRNITNLKRIRNQQEHKDALEMLKYDAHAAIIAPSEKELKVAVQKIEWLMSDDLDAVAFRAGLKVKTEQGSGYSGAATKAAQENYAMNNNNNSNKMMGANTSLLQLPKQLQQQGNNANSANNNNNSTGEGDDDYDDDYEKGNNGNGNNDYDEEAEAFINSLNLKK